MNYPSSRTPLLGSQSIREAHIQSPIVFVSPETILDDRWTPTRESTTTQTDPPPRMSPEDLEKLGRLLVPSVRSERTRGWPDGDNILSQQRESFQRALGPKPKIRKRKSGIKVRRTQDFILRALRKPKSLWELRISVGCTLSTQRALQLLSRLHFEGLVELDNTSRYKLTEAGRFSREHLMSQWK